MNIDLTNIEEIIETLEKCDDAYFNTDKVHLTDAEYDQLKRVAHKLDPKNPYFVKVGADVRGGKIKLPYPMNGLDQIYESEIQPLWVKKYGLDQSEIVITDKLDGVSCLLLFADKDGDGNAEFQIAYSRGNSVEGADITRHVKKIDFPKIIHGYTLYVVRAELIMKDKTFRDNWANEFSSARALVAGAMNRKDNDDKTMQDIDLIAYSVVDAKVLNLKHHSSKKIHALTTLKSAGFKTPFTQIVKGYQLSDSFLIDTIKASKASSAYELDGIVLSENMSNQSVKYKTIDANSITSSALRNLPWEISKHGLLKPRVEIDPVKLFDTVVTFATAFNAKYIYENQIGPGSVITLTKSGSVIPYILASTKAKIVDYDMWFKDELDRVAGKDQWEWNENGVEIILKNPNAHPTVRFKQVLDFFESIEVDLLKEASLRTLLDHYNWFNNMWTYENTIATIFDLSEHEWEKIIGANGSKIYASLHRRLVNMKPEVLLGSLNYCGFGFGVRRAKILLSQLSKWEDVWNLSEHAIEKLNGFDQKTASKIAAGIPKIKQFLQNNSMFINVVVEKKTDELKDISVVFTGFRDNELEAKVEKMGGKVSSGVSKKTTYLVAADPSSNSGKAGKARDLGVKVLSIDQFKDMFNL